MQQKLKIYEKNGKNIQKEIKSGKYLSVKKTLNSLIQLKTSIKGLKLKYNRMKSWRDIFLCKYKKFSIRKNIRFV